MADASGPRCTLLAYPKLWLAGREGRPWGSGLVAHWLSAASREGGCGEERRVHTAVLWPTTHLTARPSWWATGMAQQTVLSAWSLSPQAPAQVPLPGGRSRVPVILPGTRPGLDAPSLGLASLHVQGWQGGVDSELAPCLRVKQCPSSVHSRAWPSAGQVHSQSSVRSSGLISVPSCRRRPGPTASLVGSVHSL